MEGLGSISGQGTEILQASWPKKSHSIGLDPQEGHQGQGAMWSTVFTMHDRVKG